MRTPKRYKVIDDSRKVVMRTDELARAEKQFGYAKSQGMGCSVLDMALERTVLCCKPGRQK